MTDSLSSDQGRPISMVSYDINKRKFILNPEIEQLVKPLSAPLGVISVAGMYRTGKSYLLNRTLLNNNRGFSVGPSINPCTKGLWLWSKPIQAHSRDGKPISALIIDTEGIGATDEDNNHDNKIMTLAILLSSYFLFNSLGTIDENAIQNLSFIVDITRRIREKNSENKDENFVKNLPSFLWVIRDFALQLRSRDGVTITSNEYLERSLEYQKGDSEFVRRKNEIRKMVKEFFPRRECVTLVRPLTEENHLQSLESLDDSKLRKEFIEQINSLRKIILNNINPKMINGKELNGENLIDVAKCYVEMINKGAVPVIQTAWTFMIQSQIETAKKSAVLDFRMKILDIEKKLPLNSNILKSILMSTKYEIISAYLSSLITEPNKEDIISLKKQLEEAEKKICQKNFEESKILAEKCIDEKKGEIRSILINIKSLKEYKEELESFAESFLNKCIDGPLRESTLFKFLSSLLISDIKGLVEEKKRALKDEKEKKNEEMMRVAGLKEEAMRVRSEMEKEKENVENKMRDIKGEKENIDRESGNEKENMDRLIQEKNKEFEILKKRLSDVEKEGETKIIEIKKKYEIVQRETHSSDLETTVISSNCGKEKILLEQKVKFLEKCLKDLEDQNNSLQQKALPPCSEEDNINKEKLEEEIKSLNKKVKELQEKGFELDSQLIISNKKIENEKNNCAEILENYQKKIEEMQENNLEMAKNINRYKESLSQKLDELSGVYENRLSQLEIEETDKIEKDKEEEDRIKKQLVKANAEYNVSLQEKEIAEKKISQLKEQSQSEKLEHDKLIKILEESNKELMEKYENSTQSNEQLKSCNNSELTKLQSENGKKEEEIKKKNELLNLSLSELSKENDEKVKALKRKVKDTENIIIPEIRKEISELKQKKLNAEKEYEENVKGQKHRLDEISLGYENQKENILTKNREQLEFENNENQSQIEEKRKLFQLEKEKVLRQLQEESAEFAKALSALEETHAEKLAQTEKEKDDKISELQEALDEVSQAHEEYAKKIERELLVRNQKIESMQKFVEDTRKTINTIKLQQENHLKELLEEFENDKAVLNEKIRKAQKDQEETEIEYQSLVEQTKSIENSGDDIKEQIENLRAQISKTRSENESKLSDLRNGLAELKRQESVEALTQEKELSLRDQNIKFLNDGLNELKEELERSRKNLEDKIREEKDKIVKEYEEKIKKILSEKENIEKELNEIEESFNQLQMKYSSQTESLTKEKESYLEELNELLQKKKSYSEDLENGHTAEKTENAKIRTELKNKNDSLQKLNIELQKKLQKLENDYNVLMGAYENEKSNFESKFVFIEEQKNQLTAELNDLKEKYDANMDELQQKILAERERLEAIYKKSLLDGENIHNQQLKQAQDTFNKKYEEVNVQNNNLISENAILEKKIEEYQNDSHVSDIDIRLQEALEEEKKLREEIENENNRKNEIIENLKQQMNRETEIQNQKIEELTLKLQEYDDKTKNNNANLLKDKAVNEKDAENKVLEIQQLNEHLQSLKAENEKLMNQNKEVHKENETYRKTSRNASRHTVGLAYIPKRKHISIISGSGKENVPGNLSSYSGSSVGAYNENIEDKKVNDTQIQQEEFKNMKSKSQLV